MACVFMIHTHSTRSMCTVSTGPKNALIHATYSFIFSTLKKKCTKIKPEYCCAERRLLDHFSCCSYFILFSFCFIFLSLFIHDNFIHCTYISNRQNYNEIYKKKKKRQRKQKTRAQIRRDTHKYTGARVHILSLCMCDNHKFLVSAKQNNHISSKCELCFQFSQ